MHVSFISVSKSLHACKLKYEIDLLYKKRLVRRIIVTSTNPVSLKVLSAINQ